MRQGKFLTISAIIWSFLTIVMVGGMVYYTYGYAQEPKVASSSISEMERQEISEVSQESYTVYPVEKSSLRESFVSVPLGTELSQVKIKKDYLRQCIYVYIENKDISFYKNEPSFYISNEIQGVYYYRGNGQDAFIILLNDLYECEYEIKEGSLFLTIDLMSEKYDNLVVMDIETDSLDTTDMALGIMESHLSVNDTKILMINHNEFHEEYGDEITRLLQMVEKSGADYYIQVTTGQSDESPTEGMRAYYQKQFYTNGFGSIELADSLEKYFVTEVSGKAEGLFEAQPNMQELIFSGVPSARLYVGSYANEEEALMLDSDLFWEKAGAALSKTIMEAYGE